MLFGKSEVSIFRLKVLIYVKVIVCVKTLDFKKEYVF